MFLNAVISISYILQTIGVQGFWNQLHFISAIKINVCLWERIEFWKFHINIGHLFLETKHSYNYSIEECK